MGVLYIFWARGCALEKGTVFNDFGIRNGIDFHNFGIRNGTDFYDFGRRNGMGAFSANWYKVGYLFSEKWYKVGYIFLNIGVRNGYVFEASMARPRPKSGQVPPPGRASSFLSLQRLSPHEGAKLRRFSSI